MTTRIVYHLGQLGAIGGAAPFQLTARRHGTAIDLTGYTGPRLEAWDLRTRTALTDPATVAITTAADGLCTVTPAATFHAASGTYEGRLWITPAAGAEQPFDLVRWHIGAGAHAP